MKKVSIDWRLVGGFSALLVLMVVIGAIGIFQIQSLSKRVDDFGNYYFPLQKAALEMRINNSLSTDTCETTLKFRFAAPYKTIPVGINKPGI